MTGKRSDADEAHRLRGRKALSNPGQELKEVQLIEEIVLEPQNQLIVRLVTFDRGSPLPQIVHGVVRRRILGPAR